LQRLHPGNQLFHDESPKDTLVLSKILALGSQQVERGDFTPIGEVADRLRAKASSL